MRFYMGGVVARLYCILKRSQSQGVSLLSTSSDERGEEIRKELIKRSQTHLTEAKLLSNRIQSMPTIHDVAKQRRGTFSIINS